MNLKGGTAKTTSAAYLLAAFHNLGLRAVGIDADPQGSLLRWHAIAGWPWTVIAYPHTQLHYRLRAIVDPSTYDVMIIDTPPLEEAAGIVASALRAATEAIVPMAPTTMELDRLGPVWRAIDDAAAHPDRVGDLPARVLLNRVHPTAAATAQIRAWLTGGQPVRSVFATAIPHRVGQDGYGQAFGDTPPGDDGPYNAVATEILESWNTGVSNG